MAPSFQQDRFLGSTSGGDIEELINALGEKVFYRDGSRSMDGPIGMDGNNIIGPAVIETNELALGITPAAGKVSIYALTDKKLYIKNDAGLETELGAGGSGDVEYTGSPTMPSTNEICIFDSTDGLKIKNSEVQFPLVGGSSGEVLTLTGTGNTSQWAASGSGDVTGPASSTINRLSLFSDLTGKVIKQSSFITDTAGELAGVAKLNIDDLELNDNKITTTSGDLELDSNNNFVKIDANTQIVGDLTVDGTTTTTHSENVYINANYLHNNTDYGSTISQTGGLTVRLEKVSGSVDFNIASVGFVAGVAGVSNPTVRTVAIPPLEFAVGSIIGISGATNPSNNGLYEVLSHTSGTFLTIRGIGTTSTIEDFTNNQFITEAGTGTCTHVNVTIIRADTSGDWEVGKGDSTAITYSKLALAGVVGDVSSGSNFTDDNRITRTATVAGVKNIQQSGIIIDDSDNISGITNLTAKAHRFEEPSGSNYFEIEAPSMASNYTITTPATAATTDRVQMLTNFNGICSWSGAADIPYPNGFIHGGLIAWVNDGQIVVSPVQSSSRVGVEMNLNRSSRVISLSVSGVGGILPDSFPATNNTWYQVILIGDRDGVELTEIVLVPYAVGMNLAGYTSQRRIGWIRVNSTGDIMEFGNPDSNTADRFVLWQISELEAELLTNGSATSWTVVDLSDLIPPGCRMAYINTNLVQDAALQGFTSFRTAGLGGGTSPVTNPKAHRTFAGVDGATIACSASNCFFINTNSAQEIEYGISNGVDAGEGTDIWVLGFIDSLA